jgi:DNA ligase-1
MFKVWLAPSESEIGTLLDKHVKFPVFGSFKIDGIRAYTWPRRFMQSRENIEIPSKQCQMRFARFSNLDGELIDGEPFGEDVFKRTSMTVTAKDQPSDPRFFVFDLIGQDAEAWPFEKRYDQLQKVVSIIDNPHIICLEQRLLETPEDVMSMLSEASRLEYEGLMLKRPDAIYKHGRATLNEQTFFKVKTTAHHEATIKGFQEAVVNLNEATVSETGKTKRSKRKEGLVPGNTLGAFIVDFQGREEIVPCGSLSHDDRKFIWEERQIFLGERIRVKSMTYGQQEKWRQARFDAFLNPELN